MQNTTTTTKAWTILREHVAKAIDEITGETDTDEFGCFGDEIMDAMADACMACLRVQATTNKYRDENP